MTLERIASITRGNTSRAAADGDLVVKMAFASEEPYERWWGIEVLEVSSKAVRLGRLNDGAPVLFNHDWNDLRGVHVPGSVKPDADRVLRGDIRLTAATQAGRDAIALVEGEVLTKASVGYEIHLVIEKSTKKSGESVEREIDGRTFRRLLDQHGMRDGRPVQGDARAFQRDLDKACGPFERAADEVPTYIVKDWEPIENSLVTVPADPTVGVGRNFQKTTFAAPAAQPKESTVTQETPTAAGTAADSSTQVASMAAQVRQGPTALEMEGDRRQAIENLCKANNIDDGIRSMWITSGASMRSVSDELLQIIGERAKSQPKVTQVGLTSNETRKFSLSRAIEACAGQNWTHAGFEAEVSRTIQLKLNRNASPNKFYVPWEVQERANRTPLEDLAYSMAKRDLTVASAASAGYLKETSNVGFIELLRNRSVLMNMGAMRLSGLQGDVTIPKQTATGSATWLANEAAAITELNQTFAQVALSPKNVGGYTEISRQLLLQSNPYVEGLVMSDLAAVVALDIDLKGLNGSGASGQPTGILNTAGIGSVTGTSLDYADIVEFQTDVFAGNALTGNSGYVTTGAVAGLLKSRVKFASTASPIWNGRLDMADVDGYRGMASNQVPAATMLYGDFGLGVVIAEWGVLEIEVNPYANFQAGIVGVRAIASVDIGVRYPTAFSAASSIT